MSSLLEVAPNNSSNMRASTLPIFPVIIEDHLRGFPRTLAKLPPTLVIDELSELSEELPLILEGTIRKTQFKIRAVSKFLRVSGTAPLIIPLTLEELL